MVAQQTATLQPEPTYWPDAIASLEDVVLAVGREGVERAIFTPAAPDLRLGDARIRALGGASESIDSEWVFNLAVEAADFGLQLGFGLALTRAQALDDRLSFEAWLAAALARVGLQDYKLHSHFEPPAAK